jgi:hypothetical protein
VAGGNDFFGYRVETAFTDEDAFWRGILLSIGAGPESFAHLSLVRRLAGCNFVADPRIWPLKISRVLSSYGNTIPALCGGNVFLEGARVGPVAARESAGALATFAATYSEPWKGGDLETELLRRLERGERIAGYGVAFRRFDERVEVVDRIVREEGRETGLHWRCSLAVEAILAERRVLPRNVVSASAAALLDCGFTPRQIGLLMWYYFVPTFMANAVEGAEQAPAMLRELPLEAVEYVGPAPRRSGRS